MGKKYELTDETMEIKGRTLHRIRALRDIDEITKAGAVGGWIENEGNLDQDGDAWVYGTAWVCGTAQVYGNARVYGDALVYGDARVCGDAWVYGNAQVYGDVWVYGTARVYGDALVYGDARVCDNATIRSATDYLTVGPIGSRDGITTFFRDAISGISVACGCFSGTLEEFRARVEETHAGDKYGAEYRAAIELAERVLLPRLKMEASEDQ